MVKTDVTKEETSHLNPQGRQNWTDVNGGRKPAERRQQDGPRAAE